MLQKKAIGHPVLFRHPVLSDPDHYSYLLALRIFAQYSSQGFIGVLAKRLVGNLRDL